MRDRQLQLLLTPLGQQSLKEHQLPYPTRLQVPSRDFSFQYWGGEDIVPMSCHTVDGIWMFCEDFVGIYRDCHEDCRFVNGRLPSRLVGSAIARSKILGYRRKFLHRLCFHR